MGRQHDRNRMAAVMASVRESEGVVAEPLSEKALTDYEFMVALDTPYVRLKTADFAVLVANVRVLRTVLNDLLLTRQAHEEADENMSVLLCTEGPDAPTEDELRDAADAVGEAVLAHEAAWDRARSLLAGEEK